MTRFRRFAIGLLTAVLIAPAAFAQQQPVSPYGNAPPAGAALRTPPVSQPTNGTQSDAGSNASLYRAPPTPYVPPPYNPGPVYPPYYGAPYIEGPTQGYLNGVAAVTTAQGQYYSQVQQARLLQNEADSSKLDLRRKFVEQQRYLKSLEPTAEEMRQKDITDAINRSRNNPPATEIWSGKALNDLLLGIQRDQRGGVIGPAVPIDPAILRHINLTTGATGAGGGMLKDLRRFQWPLALLDDPFNEGRTQIETLGRQAADQAGSGPVDGKLIRDLQKSIADMIAGVKAKVDDLTPTQYVQSMRYLRELNDSTKVLRDPNVSNYFNDKYQATGSTVAELVNSVTSRGLLFAPANSGDESYYTVVHGAMVNYDYGLRQLAAR